MNTPRHHAPGITVVTQDSFFGLCPPMCGKAVPFRQAFLTTVEAPPQRGRRSRRIFLRGQPERQSLSAYQAAQPQLRVTSEIFSLRSAWRPIRRAARSLLLLLAAVLALGLPLRAQMPQVINPNDATPKGSITGRVVGEDGQPISNVTVMAFTRGGRGDGSSASGSDAKGKFTLSNLMPGAYNLNAFAPGYVLDADFMADPSERNYYRPGDSATLRLIKGGVITGTVTDTNGVPLVGARVNVSRVREADGRLVRDARPSGFSPQRQTDDRGVYRLYGLRPGAYVVAAGGKGGFSFGQVTAYDADAPTYYPSTTRDTAVEVSVQTGQEMTGVDIRHRREPGRVISGTISNTLSSGQPVNGNISVTVKHVSASTPEGFAFIQPGAGNNGFSFEGLPDGDYDITAVNLSPAEGNAAAPPRRVSVRGADVTGIKLTLAPLASIAGRIVFEAAKPAPGKNTCQPAPAPRPEETVIFMRRDEPGGGAAASQINLFFAANNETTADGKGDFNVLSLEAGRYRPAVRLFDEDSYVRAISLPAPATKTPPPAAAPGAAATPTGDPARDGLSLRAGERLTGLAVNIVGGAASLRGRIVVPAATEDADSTEQPFRRVHLIPAEREQADNVLRYAEVAPLADGSFTFNHLAPGRYFIIARRAPDNESANNTQRPLAWDAAARAALRREAESANVAVELAPCQRLNDYLLLYPKK